MLTVRSALGRTRLAEELGQAIPLFAAGVFAMVAMAGIVIDGGNLFQNRQSLQNVADAAALGAALYVADNSATCAAGASDPIGSCAGQYASLNGANGATGNSSTPLCVTGSPNACALPKCNTGPGLTVSDTQAPTLAPGCYLDQYGPNNDEVEVWLTRRTSNFFGGILGITNSSESARAVAQVTPSNTNPGPGIYIYSTGDVKLNGGATVEEPVFARGNLCMNGGTRVYSISRIVAVGLSGSGTVLGGNSCNSASVGGTLGDSQPSTPTTTLQAPGLPASFANNPMSVASTTNFQSPGTVFVSPSGASCTASKPTPPCEWIAYTGKSASQLGTTNLFRGFGGDNSTPPAHTTTPIQLVDPRLAEFWSPNACSTFVGQIWFDVNQCQPVAYTFSTPGFNVNTAFTNAQLGPGKSCDSGGSVPGGTDAFFGVASGLGAASPGPTTNLTPNAGYICKRLGGEIAWGGNGGVSGYGETVPRREFKVVGTIFFNADLRFSNTATYQTFKVGGATGGAVLWSTGKLILDSGTSVLADCGTGSLDACDTASPSTTPPQYWNPNVYALGIVAHKATPASSSAINDITFNGGNTELQALVYTDGAFKCGGNCTFQGLLDGSPVEFAGGTAAPSPAIGDLPANFPQPLTVTLVG